MLWFGRGGGTGVGIRIISHTELQHRLDWSNDTWTVYFTNFREKKKQRERRTRHFTTSPTPSVWRVVMEESSGELPYKNFKRTAPNSEITATSGRKQLLNQCSLVWTLRPKENDKIWAIRSKLSGGVRKWSRGEIIHHPSKTSTFLY